MKKNLKTLFLLLIASLLMMACGLSSSAVDEVPVEATAEEQADTPVEEPTAEPTSVPDMDLTDLILTAADFPDIAFTEVSLEEMGMSVDDLDSKVFTVESFFALLESTSFEMVMGFTTQLNSPLERVGFDLVLNQPNKLIETFLGGIGDMGNAEPEELPEFSDTVGDSSVGMTVLTKMQGMGMRMDVVVFRRDSIGSFILTMYLDGQTPPASLMDVAQKFDEKIVTFLANQ